MCGELHGAVDEKIPLTTRRLANKPNQRRTTIEEEEEEEEEAEEEEEEDDHDDHE